MQMNSRIGLIVLALLIGAAAGSVIPGVWNTLRQALGLVSEFERGAIHPICE